jgi:nitronate monooxygenase
MAAAVTNAGGLGSLGIGAMTPATARAAILEAQSLTSGPINVNVFVHVAPTSSIDISTRWLDALRPVFREFGAEPPSELKVIYRGFNDDPDVLAMLLEVRPAVVSFHFGLPSPEAVRRLKEQRAVLVASVTSLEEARAAEAAGMDAVVAQGYEAGGHRGIFDPFGRDDQLSTVALVRTLVKRTTLPVIAAGGIMDGQGVRAALELGAIAAQMGTAFVVTDESAADEHHRTAIANGEGTTMTTSISGRPARSMRNRYTELEELEGVEVPHYPLTYDVGKALNAAAKGKGEGGFGAQWSGQAAGLARPMSGAELMRVLEEELGQA